MTTRHFMASTVGRRPLKPLTYRRVYVSEALYVSTGPRLAISLRGDLPAGPPRQESKSPIKMIGSDPTTSSALRISCLISLPRSRPGAAVGPYEEWADTNTYDLALPRDLLHRDHVVDAVTYGTATRAERTGRSEISGCR
ncbi:MAG: hypothetical protein JWQ74_98 [Marmoricola sp.]|nr:hypothetical protein [Marmoricola sp.]